MDNAVTFADQAKKAAEGCDFFPLPSGASRLYLQFKSRNLDYSQVADIKAYIILDKSIDAHRLAKAVEDTVKAHSIYSAEVVERDGIPGFVKSDKFSPVEIKEIRDEEFPECEKLFFSQLREKGSALYKVLILSTPTRNYMLQSINHTISDLSSSYLMIAEIASRYEGKEVAPEEVDMLDYIAYQQCFMKSGEAAQYAREFDQLAAGYLTMPSPVQLGEPVQTDVLLATKQELNTLRPLSKRLGVGVTNCIVAGIALAIMRLHKKDRLMMGNSYHGRYENTLQHIHGCLAHSMPVMAKIPESGRVEDYLSEFGRVQDLMMDKYIRVIPYILQKYSMAMLQGGALNIRLNERPVMIAGTEAKTVKKMGVVQKLPLYTSLDIEPDGWHLRFMSAQWGEEDLKALAASARKIILGMAEKELISEL